MATSTAHRSEAVEMSAKGRPPSLFTQKLRPVSQITDISDSDWDDDKSDSGSEFEENSDSPRGSFDTENSYDEAPTPQSTQNAIFNVQVRRSTSTTGPRGPHLFRTSFDSTSDYALQMSPVQAKAPNILGTDTVSSPLSLEADSLPFKDLPEPRNPEHMEVKDWTPQEVALWMHHAGFEEEIIEMFEDNDVNGTVLLDIKFEDLKEFGIPSFGKRHQIWTELGKLREDGHSSPAPTAIESRPATAPGTRERHDEKASTPTIARRRRLARVKNVFDEDVAPAESVSIVAIEQLLPKPHKCSKGENCPKWKKQQRIKEQLDREHGFSISPTKGGHIFIAGNPGEMFQSMDQPSEKTTRPLSDTGPSVVASSDLLGPGQAPKLTLDDCSLQDVQRRDPQEHVKQFLTFQHLRTSPEIPPTPPMETPRFNPAKIPDTPGTDTMPVKTPTLPSPHSNLQQLPKLSIPRSSSTNPRTSASRKQTPVPGGNGIQRLHTPSSEMDVPMTSHADTPIPRDASQSVPPNMRYRQQTKHRPGSRDQNVRRQSSTKLPTLPEDPIAGAPVKSALLHSPVKEPIRVSSKALYGKNTTHSGYMKKRKTKLLHHEWNEHHFRLQGTTLAMHASAKPEDRKALETINVDDFSVACSSLASNSKLAAALKSLKITSGKRELSFEEAAFAFQLIPATERAKALSMLKEGKTHYFAVKSRDERIDWMREIMLAKATKAKEEGFEVSVNGETI